MTEKMALLSSGVPAHGGVEEARRVAEAAAGRGRRSSSAR